ncbi:2-(1,2-epoxy-1,2-dihydrophenyl)acetyl-CoA isomerase [Alteripontixanthobacter maritimus]|uniref:2-(1,2-epoxy-1,2-dihydrophenyl)acetyl-CoA isomerase n=1 Tax=Alteripontixanthobacter maritimus TaxID=2161824 RepID=A0A369QBL8_9SPHN|nr:enoyl-CoA hydratase-related protein [Alteripontixanthobacter maritimus]RDC59638.1 2-(1,2-epoxy-1,2-dihydrophenyl)acetyl-CoA isomerase [Alteripontixanthobacter maritimus]
MSYEHILVETADDVTTITLNRPDRLNACPPDMGVELRDVFADPGDARCILVTGAGRAFCSGADLANNADSGATSPGRRAYDSLSRSYNPLMMQMAQCEVPIVSAVNGPAAGVGCSIALAADFVFAGSSAYFLQAFVNIGLVPDGGASWMLPRLIGKARATEMMMLGEKIGAEKAAEWGLIYKAVSDDALMDEARALAVRLAGGPTQAIGQMRANIMAALQMNYPAALHQEALGQRKAGESQDAVEGAVAFLQKRKAEFTGK